jgi:hypothetical protein
MIGPRTAIAAAALICVSSTSCEAPEPTHHAMGPHGADPPPTQTHQPPVSRGTGVSAWSDMPQHWVPGPADAQHVFDPERAKLEHACRTCHPAHAHEWAGSGHAMAWSSAAFQRAFDREPLPFCQSCHAPETSPRAPVPADAAEIGIGCVTCHVQPGTDLVWTAEAREPALEAAPHPVARSRAFAGPPACAGCHEFDFPDRALRLGDLAMQSTISEHAASQHRSRSCADCHMPVVRDGGSNHRSHAFPGAGDRSMLGRALRVDSERVGTDRVRLVLRPGEVGHAVPTGDHLRRLEVALLEIDSDGRERLLDRQWLRREFADRPHRNGIMLRDQVADTRVGVGEQPAREVVLRIPGDADGRSLIWRVLHQRVADGGTHPRAVRIDAELEIARGSVPSWSAAG